MRKKSSFPASLIVPFICFCFSSCILINEHPPVRGSFLSDPPIPPSAWNMAYNFHEDDIKFNPVDFKFGKDDEYNSLSIACGNGTIVVGSIFDGKIACSTNNGITWIEADSGLNAVISLVYSNGLFAALGEYESLFASGDEPDAATAEIAVSSNGIDWNIVASLDNAPREIFGFNGTFFSISHKRR